MIDSSLIVRRRFLRNSLIATASAAITMSTRPSFSEEATSNSIAHNSLPLSAKSIQFMNMMNIKYPIIQAPTGSTATTELAIAVAEKGALAALPLTWTSAEDALNKINAIKEATKGSFFANFLLQFDAKSFDSALQAGVKVVQFSWGMPTADMIAKLRKAGIIMGIQVTSEASAQAAIDAGADYLVCQGTEAGGHVHASRPLADALTRVLSVAGDIPVAASGGIATGKDIRKYLELGAAAVVMGSRFVASQESGAHDKYKASLVDASSEDTVFTVCFNKGWANATHRVIRNKTFEMWEAAGCPTLETSPGVEDVIGHFANGRELSRYSFSAPISGMTGQVTDGSMYAGKGVEHIKDIPSVAEIIDRLWDEYLV
jgi:nitronate monooxygenase